jgi:hypothetical protein
MSSLSQSARTPQRHVDPDRVGRAFTEMMAVDQIAPGMFEVQTITDEYVVDLHGRACECEDFRNNDPEWCKHLLRAKAEQISREL